VIIQAIAIGLQIYNIYFFFISDITSPKSTSNYFDLIAISLKKVTIMMIKHVSGVLLVDLCTNRSRIKLS
jgi:hypothetical protein